VTLQTLSSRAGRALVAGGVPHRAADDLAWAWFNLGAAGIGQTIVGRLGGGSMDQDLDRIFSQPWEILEVAAMSLAFEDTMTALDLCADAAMIAGGQPILANGKFYDVGLLRRDRGKLTLTSSVGAWVDQLLPHADLALLVACRNPLTHQTVRRHIGVTLGTGIPTGRSLAEITTLHGNSPAQNRGSIGVLIPQLVSFGEVQVEKLCNAVLADFPAPP
jgi:hypothetical protein